MTESIGEMGVFTRFGMDTAKSVAVLSPLPKNIERALDRRVGVREAFRDLLVKALRQLWDSGAMGFDESGRVERVLQALIPLLTPD